MSVVKDAVQAVMKKAIALAPDGWIPGAHPDPLMHHKHGLIGASISRLDGPLKVAGKAQFCAEFPMERLTYAALKYSTIARGRITEIDTSKAAAAPGVVLVMTHRNTPKLNKWPPFMSKPKAGGPDDLPIMQDDRIHWNGQPVALVLAETQEQAEHAQMLIRIVYEEQSPVISLAAAKTEGSEPGVFMGEPLKLKVGDAEDALAVAPHKIDVTYTTPRHHHAPIELHACTLAWNGDELRIHDASQAVAHEAWTIAQVFGLEEKQVRLTSPFVGGGFGSKLLWQHQILAAAAAKLAGRPVRIMLSREGVFRIVGGRTVTEQRVALGAQADGRLDALIHTGVVAMTPHNSMPEPFVLPAKSVYASKTFFLDVETVKMNMVANTFMRAPAKRSARSDSNPRWMSLLLSWAWTRSSCGSATSRRKTADGIALLTTRNRAGLARRRQSVRLEQAERDACGEARRRLAYRHGLRHRHLPLLSNARRSGAHDHYLRGKATVAIAAHEMGMGTATAQAQVAAERLGLPLEQVEVLYGDTLFPGAVLAGGSQQTASIGASIIAAHQALVKELLKLAGNDSPLAGLSPNEVGSSEGGLCARDDESRRESYVSILSRARREEVTVEAEAPMPLELQHWSMHSHSALFCEIRVNVVTGEMRLSRFLGSFDCGRILNAKTAASQFRGGIIMASASPSWKR